MKNRKLRAPSPALIVATCALVFSMAGTGYAVNQINGKTIKKGTIAGKALKKNTLTGKEINESKLGTVPKASEADKASSASTAANAANATNAANANRVAGLDPAEFARNANFVRTFKSMDAGDPDVTLVTSGDIAVKMSCTNNGASDFLSVYATTSNDGALLDSQKDDASPLDTTTLADDSEIGEGLSDITGTFARDDGYDDTGFVINAANSHLITLLEGSSTKILNRGGKTCIFGGTFIVE